MRARTMLNTWANQNSWWMFLSRGVHINGMKTGEATGACHVSICLGYPAVMLPKKHQETTSQWSLARKFNRKKHQRNWDPAITNMIWMIFDEYIHRGYFLIFDGYLMGAFLDIWPLAKKSAIWVGKSHVVPSHLPWRRSNGTRLHPWRWWGW